MHEIDAFVHALFKSNFANLIKMLVIKQIKIIEIMRDYVSNKSCCKDERIAPSREILLALSKAGKPKTEDEKSINSLNL